MDLSNYVYINDILYVRVVSYARVFMQVVACMYTRHSTYVCVQHAGLIHGIAGTIVLWFQIL